MSSTDDLSDEQRRNHVRAPMSQPCIVHMYGEETLQCELRDLSGTGCSFRIGSHISTGQRGRIKIAFETWTLETTIVVKSVASSGALSDVGAGFDSLLKAEIEQIVKEVFAQLRKSIRSQRIVD